MILTAHDYARFESLDAASRWQIVENYRSAAPDSAVGRRQAVENLLEKLCQQVHATLWAPRFDAQAWALVHHQGQGGPGQQACPARGPDASWEALAALSTKVDWWPIFDHGQPDPFTLGQVATLAQAGAAYPPLDRCPTCGRPPAATADAGRRANDAGPREVVIDVSDPTSRSAAAAR